MSLKLTNEAIATPKESPNNQTYGIFGKQREQANITRRYVYDLSCINFFNSYIDLQGMEYK